jgi:outer membrane protein assembly factor BamA
MRRTARAMQPLGRIDRHPRFSGVFGIGCGGNLHRAEQPSFNATRRSPIIAGVSELAGLPAYIKLDQTDNLLNPATGYRAQLSVTPARTFSGSRLTFATNLLAGSTYWPLGDEQRTVLAGKLALGSLDGAPLFQLPADQRIYAGGGGSIRPYGGNWRDRSPLT